MLYAVLFGLLTAATTAWAYRDARRRGEAAGEVALAVALLGPFALPLWWLARGGRTVAAPGEGGTAWG